MRRTDLNRFPSWLPWTVGCALGIWLGHVPTKRLDPFRELRPSPGRLVGLAYRAEIGTPPRKRAIEVSKDNERLILEEGSLEKRDKLRSRAVYSLAGNRPDPAIEYLEEAVETTEGLEQALLRSDLAAALIARSWPEWKNRPGFFARGDDLFRAVDLAAQTLEIIPDLKEAQFNLALGLETLTLRETAKEEWKRYLALDPGSSWANEAREHQRRLAVPIPTKPQPNAMNPEGPLNEADPAVRLYRAGRNALREQRYGEARAAFREARELWRSSNPRMAGWAMYRIGVCDYFDPRHSEGDLSPTSLVDSAQVDDPALAARSTYLYNLQVLPEIRSPIKALFLERLGSDLRRAKETGDFDLISRFESALATTLGPDRHRAGLHHLLALGESLAARSPNTRLTALEKASRSMGGLSLFRVAAFFERERLHWIDSRTAKLHPLSRLRALCRLSWWEYSAKRLDLARSTILQATQENNQVRSLPMRLAFYFVVSHIEDAIFVTEQAALFGKRPDPEIIPSVRDAIDRERYVPELLPLADRDRYPDPGNRIPLADQLHREVDRLETDADIVSERPPSDWWLPSPEGFEDILPRPSAELQHLGERVFGPKFISRVFAPDGGYELLVNFGDETKLGIQMTVSGPAIWQSGPIKIKRLQAAEYLRNWQEGSKNPRPVSFRRAREGLMRDLVNPLVQQLGPSAKKVGLISGNRILDHLPLAAIRDPLTGRFLVELYEMFVLPEYASAPSQAARPILPPLAEATRTRALGTFPAPRTASSEEPRVLLVLGAASPRNPNPLSGGEREIEALAHRFPNHRILRGAEATKENVLAGLQWATIAHFATHGLIDGDDPDDTGLLLLPGDSTDSRLTVGDVKKLSLPHLRLVVLSTCNSGRSTGSPESLSVASAFIARGVPAAVATLMPIDDRVAPLFFKPFYDHLDQTGDPIRALRQTQIDFARGPDPDSTLRIWAPYVVMISPGLPLPE